MPNALPAAAALALSFWSSAPGAATEAGLQAFVLSNGLTVVVVEDHRAPVAAHMVWYRVGARDDPPGQGGAAHFLEHLTFKATDERVAGGYSAVVAENGGSDNAFTSADQTVYHAHVAADRLDLIMEMEADRMVATTNSRTASSPATTTSSLSAAPPGTTSSTNLGASAPSEDDLGPKGSDQCGLV